MSVNTNTCRKRPMLSHFLTYSFETFSCSQTFRKYCKPGVVSVTLTHSKNSAFRIIALRIWFQCQHQSCLSTSSLYRREPGGADPSDRERRRQSESQKERQSSKNLPIRYRQREMASQSVVKTSPYILSDLFHIPVQWMIYQKVILGMETLIT